MSADEGIISIYNDALIALSEKTRAPRRLENPDLTARAVSPICGSEVAVDLKLDGEKISDFGFDVEACALTRAGVAVMDEAVRGKTREEVAHAGIAMRDMLENGAEGPGGPWQGLRILAPVKDYPARHNAILLVFEAVDKAFRQKDGAAGPSSRP